MDRHVFVIGMPGCGKSTVGVLLAKALGMAFMDTDVVLQAKGGQGLVAGLQPLQSFIECHDIFGI